MWEYGSRSVNSSRARDFWNVSVLLNLSHLGSWCYYLSVLVVGRLVNRGPESGRSNCQWMTFYSDRLSIPTRPDPRVRFDPGQQRNKVFTPGQFWPSGIVIGCVYGSVCSCVCFNHELVRTITHRSFKLGSPNLDQRCKTPWCRSLSFLNDRPWTSRSNLTESQILPHFELVRTITHQQFKLESPNVDRNAS